MKLFFLFFLFTFNAFATLELSHSGHNLYVDNSKNWELGKDLFGIPFILFSPQKNSQRSNISFTHTGAELELDVKILKENASDYQENKKKWANLHQVEILKFLPYKSFLNSHDHRVHSIGMSYIHRNKNYVETSFYIECKGQIVFSKSLRLQENESDEKYFHSLINSLDCGVL